MQGRETDEKVVAALKELAERLARMEARLDAIEKRLELEERREHDDICVECSSLIGCLEDCCENPEELRKRVRDVRSSTRGH